MADIVLGLLAIVAGGFMLFAGQFVLRFMLTVWGVFAGFALGAGLSPGWRMNGSWALRSAGSRGSSSP